MRPNKASQLNRNMMYMMILMAIVVLACVYLFLYISLPQEEPIPEENLIEETTDSVTRF